MALLEGFETLSGSPLLPTDLSWTGGGTLGLTESGSGSHVTQGVQSYRVNGTSLETLWQISSTGNTLTGATEVSVDLTIVSAGAATNAALLVQRPASKQSASDSTLDAETGTFTLTADISGFSGVDGLDIYLAIETDTANAVDFFWDNLRDDAGGGASVGSGLITGLKLNRMSLV